MAVHVDFWLLLGGLGFFLFGMHLTEEAVRQLGGKAFRTFLKKHTGNRIKAILSGAFVTAILQSSTVVSFMMLAFVGAGVVNMSSALAVVMGANLGTTVTGWLVATLGFKFNIETIALPVIGLAGILVIMAGKRKKFLQSSYLLLGIGTLFLGLGYMKDSVGSLIEEADLSKYADQPIAVFVLLGVLITTIIQSSSATMAITLSALYANALPFESAVAVIIGSETGTALKTVLGAAGGHAGKKQVAAGNLIFNLATTIMAFTLLSPLVFLIRDVMGIEDNLIGLVTFQSGINLLSVILFAPFISILSRLLDRVFSVEEKFIAQYIAVINPSITDAAVTGLEKEANKFIQNALAFMSAAFRLNTYSVHDRNQPPDLLSLYDELKQHEGEIITFYSKVIQEPVSADEAERLSQLTGAVREAMYACKSIKDILHDLEELNHPADDFQYSFFTALRDHVDGFHKNIKRIMLLRNHELITEELNDALKQENDYFSEHLKSVYPEIRQKKIDEIQLSTLFNINREVYLSQKAVIESILSLYRKPVQEHAAS